MLVPRGQTNETFSESHVVFWNVRNVPDKRATSKKERKKHIQTKIIYYYYLWSYLSNNKNSFRTFAEQYFFAFGRVQITCCHFSMNKIRIIFNILYIFLWAFFPYFIILSLLLVPSLLSVTNMHRWDKKWDNFLKRNRLLRWNYYEM